MEKKKERRRVRQAVAPHKVIIMYNCIPNEALKYSCASTTILQRSCFIKSIRKKKDKDRDSKWLI